MKPTEELRRGDFWAAILLLAVSIAMLGVTTTFPMTDSYGGVQNVWYVSPALFPLIVGGLLALLSLVLLAKSVTTGGARSALQSFGRLSPHLAERDRRFFIIAGLIIAFVYALVPRIDFFVGTALFLQAFTLAFYGERAVLSRLALIVFFGFALAVGVAALAGVTFGRDTQAMLICDGLGILLFVIVAASALISTGDAEERRRLRICQYVSLGVPLFLCPVFKYFLLVPLPAEGIVISLMDTVRYGLRAMLSG